MGEKRGSICFFATYRPPIALDIYSVPYPSGSYSGQDEICMTDNKFYNYNGQAIPKSALKKMLLHPKMASEAGATSADVDSGRLEGGLVFVSERIDGLETLHIALRFSDQRGVKVLNFADVYGTGVDVARLEDSGCIAGDYLIYVSTKDDPGKPHQPWTAVFQTHLSTGVTQRITPLGEADFSPSVSPDGTRLAVASLIGKDGGWGGEIEDLETNIFVIDLKNPSNRTLVVRDGGWPTWGSNNHLFFHRNIEKVNIQKRWIVYRVDINDASKSVTPVTPDIISAVTPAAINATTVVVATIRKQSNFGDKRNEEQYRHIEVFKVPSNANRPQDCYKKITRDIRDLADHFNPFVIVDDLGQKRIGYHRCKVTDNSKEFIAVETQFSKIKSPDADVGVFRVSGVFPTFSPDGSKLAFVDNEFRAVWVADSLGLRKVIELQNNKFFSPVWNQNPTKDVLYVCEGPAFAKDKEVHISSIPLAAKGKQRRIRLTTSFNNAFPSTNPEGTQIVFRSTRDGHKNLYIMDAIEGEEGGVTRLTEGACTDTHCQWSPKGDWIVFSSNRSNPDAPKKDDLPDAGYFGVYLVKAKKPHTLIKVIDSGFDLTCPGNLFPGHVNHPFFSPDGKNLVVAADLAAVSCEPISLPLFSHSVRPYGDIFIVELKDRFEDNENIKEFKRLTHSRYENSTAVWTKFSTDNPAAKWNDYIKQDPNQNRYLDPTKGESFLVTGHLCIGKRCC